jgi:DNA-binding transcriptional regulator YdaS (Cro superfamily)
LRNEFLKWGLDFGCRLRNYTRMRTDATNLKSLLGLKNMRLSHLAAALKVNKSLVTRWSQNKVPAERVLDVETATGIPRDMLRPDLYGAAPKPKAKAKRATKEAAE